MVDFHKGFEGFERLDSSKEGKKEEDLSLSGKQREPEQQVEGLVPSRSDLAKAEAFYENVLDFVRPLLDKVKEGSESQIKAEEILGWVDEFSDCFRTSIASGDLVRLALQHDEYQENYLYTHSVNVCFLAVKVALDLNFTKGKLSELVMASLLHDIGMMKIPEHIWNKDGRLTKAENEEVQKHALYGEEIVRALPGIPEAVPVIIGQHQERIDGSGYPRHLTKDAIHYGARLLALIDSYEAQTHTRLWRRRTLPDRAIQGILDSESNGYDPHFMKAMLRHISIFPVGSWVKISSGDIGMVIKTNEDTPMRPVISVVMSRDRNRFEEPRMIDLSKQFLIHVLECIDPREIEGLQGVKTE